MLALTRTGAGFRIAILSRKLLCLFFFCLPAHALELGYSITKLRGVGLADTSDGLELRAVFGGEHGDRWAVSAGMFQERPTRDGWYCVKGDCIRLGGLPAFEYASITHRWHLRPKPKLNLYIGSGISWRSAPAFDVSTKGAFQQEIGAVWGGDRAAVDVSYAHHSTGGFSAFNRGADFIRVGLFGRFGK